MNQLRTIRSLWLALTGVIALAALAPAGAQQATPFQVHSNGTVSWVADGDTMRVQIDNRSAYETLKREARGLQSTVDRDLRVNDRFRDRDMSALVRIGNIDTPESVHEDESRNTEEGAQASAYVKELMEGTRVELVCWDIGHWGRPICSLYGGDHGDRFDLGVHLVQKGYAEYVGSFGAHPYWDDEYRRAAQDAR
ncbi:MULTISPECIES: thermonuclease family protein [unclassified Thioalkalivibrio]|uniref:thermonuclease family protein n=1 Tax=unclassified Thioalkalivibrio TaxID=2621013 RepID=UPI00037A5595|nr:MULTISPECIES: thermonuclease family protein [unclassified Thioalkalivibrio]